MGGDWSLLFSVMRKGISSWEGLDKDWEFLIHASFIPPECLPGLLPGHSQGWPFMQGCQQSHEVVLFLWIHLWFNHVESLTDLVHDVLCDSALQGDGSASWWKSCCCEHSNPILQCYVALRKCRLKHTDSIILQSISFSLGEKSRLDFPALLSVLSTLISKYDSVILHEFLLPILSKA